MNLRSCQTSSDALLSFPSAATTIYPRLHLLGLPREILDQILGHIITKPARTMDMLRWPVYSSLLLRRLFVNKKLADAAMTYWASTGAEFQFHTNAGRFDPACTKRIDYIARLGAHARQYLRKLILRVPLETVGWKDEEIEKEQRISEARYPTPPSRRLRKRQARQKQCVRRAGEEIERRESLVAHAIEPLATLDTTGFTALQKLTIQLIPAAYDAYLENDPEDRIYCLDVEPLLEMVRKRPIHIEETAVQDLEHQPDAKGLIEEVIRLGKAGASQADAQ